MYNRFRFFDSNDISLELIGIFVVTEEVNKEHPEFNIGEILARVMVLENVIVKINNDNYINLDNSNCYVIDAEKILFADISTNKIYHLLNVLHTEKSDIKKELISYFDILAGFKQNSH